MLSVGSWRWYTNITITILDIIHRPVFYLKLNSTLWFLPLGVASCCALSNWFLMMPSIATKFQYINSPFLTRYMFRPLRANFRWDIQLDIFIFEDYFYHNGSVARTQFDVEMLYVLYRWFDPWSLIHVINLSTNIKIVKSLKSSVKNRSHI
jgi:hypothetical protein